MKNIALNITNLSKNYKLGRISTGTLSQDLASMWAKINGTDDPNSKVASNDLKISEDAQRVWALKDINLEVQQGEILGIIGNNGAGKSTLLKILSRITSPTSGNIKIKGRIASLLEVGTGFHPELTGMENIYLNGAILGMSKYEIKEKVEDIIQFSGIEKYIETPVKRYSSGMRVRLGFSVAAFLNPEILLVDEVLAVGDIEFRKKSQEKMETDRKKLGKTILFVSHNLDAIRKICDRVLLLHNGNIKTIGDPETVVGEYLNKTSQISLSGFWEQGVLEKENKIAYLKSSSLVDINRKQKTIFNSTDTIGIKINYQNNQPDKTILPYIRVYNNNEKLLFTGTFEKDVINNYKKKKDNLITVWLPKLIFGSGVFSIAILIVKPSYSRLERIDIKKNILKFKIKDQRYEGILSNSDEHNVVESELRPKLEWEF